MSGPVAYDAWTVARGAYSAYCARLANAKANHLYSGLDAPAWEFLDHSVKEAWKAAAESVRAALEGPGDE